VDSENGRRVMSDLSRPEHQTLPLIGYTPDDAACCKILRPDWAYTMKAMARAGPAAAVPNCQITLVSQ